MSRNRSIVLTDGSILKALTKLAMPIIGTSFVQMAYGFIDMIWVGRIGSGAVAAVGTVGFFTWLANAFIIVPRVGPKSVLLSPSAATTPRNRARHSP